MWRGYGSKHVYSGQSEDGWDCTEERVVEAPPPSSPPPYQFSKEEERGEWEEISSAIDFSWVITEMGEAEDLYR